MFYSLYFVSVAIVSASLPTLLSALFHLHYCLIQPVLDMVNFEKRFYHSPTTVSSEFANGKCYYIHIRSRQGETKINAGCQSTVAAYTRIKTGKFTAYEKRTLHHIALIVATFHAQSVRVCAFFSSHRLQEAANIKESICVINCLQSQWLS